MGAHTRWFPETDVVAMLTDAATALGHMKVPSAFADDEFLYGVEAGFADGLETASTVLASLTPYGVNRDDVAEAVSGAFLRAGFEATAHIQRSLETSPTTYQLGPFGSMEDRANQAGLTRTRVDFERGVAVYEDMRWEMTYIPRIDSDRVVILHDRFLDITTGLISRDEADEAYRDWSFCGGVSVGDHILIGRADIDHFIDTWDNPIYGLEYNAGEWSITHKPSGDTQRAKDLETIRAMAYGQEERYQRSLELKAEREERAAAKAVATISPPVEVRVSDSFEDADVSDMGDFEDGDFVYDGEDEAWDRAMNHTYPSVSGGDHDEDDDPDPDPPCICGAMWSDHFEGSPYTDGHGFVLDDGDDDTPAPVSGGDHFIPGSNAGDVPFVIAWMGASDGKVTIIAVSESFDDELSATFEENRWNTLLGMLGWDHAFATAIWGVDEAEINDWVTTIDGINARAIDDEMTWEIPAVSGGDHFGFVDQLIEETVTAERAPDLIRRLATYIVHREDGYVDLANEALTGEDWDFIADVRERLEAEKGA